MNNILEYIFKFSTNGFEVFSQLNKSVENVEESVESVRKSFGGYFKELMAFNEASQGLSTLKDSINELVAPGAMLNSSMLELSAITGVSGKGLKDIEEAARATAKTFGTSAVDNVESYKMILSQLSPEIAKNSEAMKMMGENVNILSKQMGGDTVAATDVLNTSLNQFGVSMDDPIEASRIMAQMMNVMSAAAQNGSAELPQIKQALEQVGMVAKTTGLSFAETNAYIQLLDQAGKKGSEGGVALRNVLTTLSEGRFTAREAAKGLMEAGISTDYLADSSVPLYQRLNSLKAIQGDTALMSKVFGRENMAAAIALINTADKANEMAQEIEGTNSAVEQAQVIMGGYNQRMARTKAWFEDLKISIFNATEGLMGYVQTGLAGVDAMGKFASGLNAISIVYKSFNVEVWKKIFAVNTDTQATARNGIVMGVWSGVGQVMTRVLGGIRNGFLKAIVGVRGFSIALGSIPVIGWIAVGITAAIVAIKKLWENSRSFREVLFGIWEAAKVVFSYIKSVVMNLWNVVIKPILEAWWTRWKKVFDFIFEISKSVISSVGSFFRWLWSDVVKPVVGWIQSTFGAMGKWIYDAVIAPLYEAFGGVFRWIEDIFEIIFSKISAVLKPIKEVLSKIFGGDVTKNIKVAYEEGKKKGGESYDKEHKKDEEGGKESILAQKQGFKVPNLGGVAAKGVRESSVGSKNGSDQGNGGVKSLTIGKLMENFVVNVDNTGGGRINEQQLLESVKKVLLTAVADMNAVV